MIHPGRLTSLNTKKVDAGAYVLYWMQASQRSRFNHALEFAIQQANELNLPLVVYFGLTDDYPEANERHYAFMLEGLIETRQELRQRNIAMVIRHELPVEGAARMAEDAAFLVCDRGYLMFQKDWRNRVALQAKCPCVQVETDVVVPVEAASSKEEYSAATIRPKIHARLPEYLVTLEERAPKLSSLALDFESLNSENVRNVLTGLKTDRSVKAVDSFTGGSAAAEKLLDEFISARLDRYPALRNDPNSNSLSGMSPYLHFGQISPVYIALRVARAASPGTESYLEELVIRRELSMNYVNYNPLYNSFEGLPNWAKRVLLEHQQDDREYTYSPSEFEAARTHDPYWNAAQTEMVLTGKMHGYMRMYWGKKIIEWSRSPLEAFETCLHLNNKYSLDGRDPNSYAGVAWCFGRHDRPWASRPVFGNVRYMNARGLKRKFDADRYADKFITLK